MVQKKNTGMWLQEAEHSNDTRFNFIVKMLLSILACAVLTLNITKISGFDQIYQLPVMTLTGSFLCCAYGIAEKYEKKNWFYLSVLAVLLLFVLIFRNFVLEGFRLFWNQQGNYRTMGTGYVVSELETLLAQEQAGKALFCFSFFAGVLCAIVCCLLNKIMSFLLPMMLLAGMIYFGQDASYRYLAVTLVVSVLFLTGSMKKKDNVFGAVSSGWMICMAAAVLLFSLFSNQKVEQFALHTSEQIHQHFHEKKFETKYTTLPEGKFYSYQEEKEPVQALSVTMEKPEALYLRGFTGGIFENDCWSPLNTEQLAESEDLLYWLNLNLFSPDTQFAAAAKKMDIGTNPITIQNIGACNQYQYVPFGLVKGENFNEKNLNQTGVLAGEERTYSYTVISDEIQMMPDVLENLQNSKESYVEDYRKAETAYRAFVYENYLEVPIEEVAPLVRQWDKIAGNDSGTKEISLEQAQEYTMIFLSKCFSKEGVPADITLPLGNVSGSSYQYATVAVLTARYFGIPARYAEGYVITEEMANAAENGTAIKVDSSHAGAWVEVYQDGIGWIPMNLIPGLGELTEEKTDPSTQNGSQTSENLELQEDLEELSEEKNNTEEPDNGFTTAVRNILHWGIFLIIVACILLLLAIFIRRKIILKRRNEIHYHTNSKEAVTWIFADTVQLLEKLKLNRGNESVTILVQPIYEKFGEIYARQFEKMVSLNSMALFSSHQVTEEQRTDALNLYDQTIEHLKKNLSFFEKVRSKWIQCLY